MPLIFSYADPVYDYESGNLCFVARDSIGRRVICTVSEAALADLGHSQGTGLNLNSVFDEHLVLIHELTEKKFDQGKIEPDGTVFLSAADLRTSLLGDRRNESS